MKKYLIMLLIVFVTGCTCNYEITFNDNSINEEITSIIYPEDQTSYNEIGDDDYTGYLLNTDINPFTNNNDIVYEKDIENDENGNQKVTLKYKYNPLDFEKYSTVLNTCFENHEFVHSGGHYYIHLTGKFYCLYGDEINLTLKSSNYVKKCNGNKQNGNCKWTINESNVDKVDIELEISSLSKTRRNIMIFIVGVIAVLVIIFLLYFVAKISNRNSINDI